MSEPLPETSRQFRALFDAITEAGERYLESVRPAFLSLAVALDPSRLSASAWEEYSRRMREIGSRSDSQDRPQDIGSNKDQGDETRRHAGGPT